MQCGDIEKGGDYLSVYPSGSAALVSAALYCTRSELKGDSCFGVPVGYNVSFRPHFIKIAVLFLGHT